MGYRSKKNQEFVDEYIPDGISNKEQNDVFVKFVNIRKEKNKEGELLIIWETKSRTWWSQIKYCKMDKLPGIEEYLKENFEH